jgi:hypothetical protein
MAKYLVPAQIRFKEVLTSCLARILTGADDDLRSYWTLQKLVTVRHQEFT